MFKKKIVTHDATNIWCHQRAVQHAPMVKFAHFVRHLNTMNTDIDVERKFVFQFFFYLISRIIYAVSWAYHN